MHSKRPIAVTRQALYRVCLALLLLFGQVGSQIHALSHLAALAAADASDEQSLPNSTACDKCLAYAQFGSAVAATPPSFDPSRVAIFAATPVPTAILVRSPLPYLARAPPHLV